jgi:hypothetical protein
MRILDALMQAMRSAGQYNSSVQAKPACILWPDHERQWEKSIPRLQSEMPELFVLGPYDAAHGTGPAIWLRCVVAGLVATAEIPQDRLPILYLPGVSRQDLRAVDACTDALKPIAELQYRGVLWSQVSAKDWTVMAFLKADQGGLSLDVAQDTGTKDTAQQAVIQLLDEEVEALRARHLDAEYFNQLLSGGDPVKNVLLWLDQDELFRSQRDGAEWQAFVAVTQIKFGLNPERDGIITGAGKLAGHKGDAWEAVWQRFCEAPGNYGRIPGRLRETTMPTDDLFAGCVTDGGWPQWNDAQENVVRDALSKLGSVQPHEARDTVAHLETLHGPRRELPWARLGQAPMACALQHLARLAATTAVSLAAGSALDMQKAYESGSWQADDAVIRALACVRQTQDVQAVTVGVRAMYVPWAEDSTMHLQQVVHDGEYPGGTCQSQPSSSYDKGECVLFVDGLRYDMGKRLHRLLQEQGLKVADQPFWVPLPTVTASGKPAVTPVRGLITGGDVTSDFEPMVVATKKSLKGGATLKKLITDAGWAVLEHANVGSGEGNAWCEVGDIDTLGHEHGAKMALDVQRTLEDVRDRVVDLVKAGWRTVRIVTDHGWLLMPGGLPVAILPAAVAESKWGRCAAIKQGAVTGARLYPWYWNSVNGFALADGISCYRAGTEYTHGGLSLQECLTLQLIVTAVPIEMSNALVRFIEVVWRGMRCTITVEGIFSGLTVDIRKHPGEAQSTLVTDKKAIREDGTASVLVTDENLEGIEAFIVLLDMNEGLIAQRPTTVGGGKA